MSPALSIYLALTSVASPAARLLLKRRLAAGKEDAARLAERTGHPSVARPKGALVWFHAASVGESLSLLPLLEKLRQDRADVTPLITTGTVTSAGLLAERLPAGAIHQYAPLDTRAAVSRFLDHWRPDLAVWVESEIWPTILHAVSKRGIPAVLLNARLSARSAARWQRLPAMAREMFGTFDYIQAQDNATGAALRDLGMDVCVAGSFKQAAPPLPCDEGALSALRDTVGDRAVWVAASTHPGEETLVLDAHRDILRQYPDALLLLVPRHPERGDSIATLLEGRALDWTRRRDGPPVPGTSVHLADTMGELGLWYRLAHVAYVGGSNRGVGGHNPYEPAILGTPVVHGPDVANFDQIYADLDAAGGTRRAGSADELARAITELFDPATAARVSAQARSVIDSGPDALKLALDAIMTRLPPVSAPAQ